MSFLDGKSLVPLLREINVQSWRIIYHVHNGQVSIVTVIHKRRHIEAGDI